MGFIAWIIVGLIAGWLAGMLMKGSGYGLIGDLILGLIGAIVGGWLFSIILPSAEPSGRIGSIIVPRIGAPRRVPILRLVRGPTSTRQGCSGGGAGDEDDADVSREASLESRRVAAIRFGAPQLLRTSGGAGTGSGCAHC